MGLVLLLFLGKVSERPQSFPSLKSVGKLNAILPPTVFNVFPLWQTSIFFQAFYIGFKHREQYFAFISFPLQTSEGGHS